MQHASLIKIFTSEFYDLVKQLWHIWVVNSLKWKKTNSNNIFIKWGTLIIFVRWWFTVDEKLFGHYNHLQIISQNLWWENGTPTLELSLYIPNTPITVSTLTTYQLFTALVSKRYIDVCTYPVSAHKTNTQVCVYILNISRMHEIIGFRISAI